MKIMTPCVKCGGDYPKYKRKRELNKTGKRGSRNKNITISKHCILCHREDQRDREERRYPKKLKYNREWRKYNRLKVNAYNRRQYLKNKRSIECF